MKQIAFIISLTLSVGLFIGCQENKASKALTGDHPEQEMPQRTQQQQYQDAVITDDSLNRTGAGGMSGQGGQQQPGQTTQPQNR